MGRILNAYIFPHPPIIIPEVGMGRETEASGTLEAVIRAAQDIKNDKPSTVIITTPHGPVFQDYIYISTSDMLEGDLGKFGNGEVKLEFANNTDLVNKIIRHANEEDILCGGLDERLFSEYRLSKRLDHGAIVPLYFVSKLYKDFKLVHISIAGLPFEDLYRFGACIARAVSGSDEQVVFLASGDMSHRLSSDAPYGFSERGSEFDNRLISSIKTMDVENLLGIDESLCEEAGECGLRSFLIMLGAVDGLKIEPQVYSYEGPFGVGYSVAKLHIQGADPKRRILQKVEEVNRIKMQETRKNEDPYVALARKALESYVLHGETIDIPSEVPVGTHMQVPHEMLQTRAGAFVSLKIKGQLRGCIGTTGPTTQNVASEIIQNAISSGTGDPRFNPVEEHELGQLVYSVDILKEPEPIESADELDVVKYGVIVRSGARSGLLLPNLEGVDTTEKQLSIALQKAGIKPGEPYSLERFEVIRHR